MNTGAVIAAVAAVITTIMTIAGAWFTRRGDRNAKLTERYFNDAELNMDMLNAVRGDYWKLFGWASIVSSKWHILIEGLPRACAGEDNEVRQLMREVGELPPIPEPEHTQLARMLRREQPPPSEEPPPK